MSPEQEQQLVKLIGDRFIARKTSKARQFADGTGWAPVREGDVDIPFKMSDFRSHFTGQQSFGHYLMGTDGLCKLFAFDIDLRKVQADPEKPNFYVPKVNAEGQYYDPRQIWGSGGFDDASRREVFRLRSHMRCLALGMCYTIHRFTGGKVHTAMMASGGKGIHVYGFVGPHPVNMVHQLALKVLEATRAFEPVRGKVFWRHKYAYPEFEVEVFPKQAEPDGKEYGNLMALPLGRHAATNQPRFFLNGPEAVYSDWLQLDPIAVLKGQKPWETTAPGETPWPHFTATEAWYGLCGPEIINDPLWANKPDPEGVDVDNYPG